MQWHPNCVSVRIGLELSSPTRSGYHLRGSRHTEVGGSNAHGCGARKTTAILADFVGHFDFARFGISFFRELIAYGGRIASGPVLTASMHRQSSGNAPPTYDTICSWAKRFNDYEHQPIVDKLTPDLSSQALCHKISVRYPELELTVSELISTGGDCKDLQSLFNEYNQLYFGGRLRRYQVLLTNDTSRCERRKRRIYINPDAGETSVILLHEMVHAAVGRGHGKVWQDKLRRLVELGAPLLEELKKYAPQNAVTRKQLLPEFFDAGLDGPPDMTWAEVRCYLGYKWGATDKHGRARSRRWSRFLRSARREWSRGRVIANA